MSLEVHIVTPEREVWAGRGPGADRPRCRRRGRHPRRACAAAGPARDRPDPDAPRRRRDRGRRRRRVPACVLARGPHARRRARVARRAGRGDRSARRRAAGSRSWKAVRPRTTTRSRRARSPRRRPGSSWSADRRGDPDRVRSTDGSPPRDRGLPAGRHRAGVGGEKLRAQAHGRVVAGARPQRDHERAAHPRLRRHGGDAGAPRGVGPSVPWRRRARRDDGRRRRGAPRAGPADPRLDRDPRPAARAMRSCARRPARR